MARMASREAKDRLEQEDNAFHQRVRLGYEKVKELYPQRIHVIDAHQSIEKVVEDCMQEIERIFDQDA